MIQKETTDNFKNNI